MTGMSVSSVSATSMTLSELFETYIACSRCCVPFCSIDALGSTIIGGNCGADQSVVQGAVETRLKASMSCSLVRDGSFGRWRPMMCSFRVLRGRRAVRCSFEGDRASDSAWGCVILARAASACHGTSAASVGASAVASAPRRRPWGPRWWLRRVGSVRGATAVLAKLQTALTLLVKVLLTGRPTDDERLITKRVKQSRHVSKTVFCCAYFCARFVAPAFAL